MIELTFSQCKQLRNNYGDTWQAIVAALSDRPDWIVEPLSITDIQAVQQGGCASGAYMPAVTYYQANATMATHGDDVLDFIEISEELPIPDQGASWTGMAVMYLSCAVEIWCGSFDLINVDWD